jgi:hypothetical protein
MRILGQAIWFLALVLLCLVTIWAAAALYIDLPATNLSLPAAILYLAVVIAVLFFFKFRWVSLGIGFALFAGVALWWCAIQRPNNHDWQLGFGLVFLALSSELDGDAVWLPALRCFETALGFAIFQDARERCAVERCDEPESSAARARIARKSLRSVRDPGSFGFLYFSETAGIDFLVASCVPPSTTMVVPTRLALRHRCGSLVVFGQRVCKRSTPDKKVDTRPLRRAGRSAGDRGGRR